MLSVITSGVFFFDLAVQVTSVFGRVKAARDQNEIIRSSELLLFRLSAMESELTPTRENGLT